MLGEKVTLTETPCSYLEIAIKLLLQLKLFNVNEISGFLGKVQHRRQVEQPKPCLYLSNLKVHLNTPIYLLFIHKMASLFIVLVEDRFDQLYGT